MYLHVGKNVVVRKKSIVAICDLDNSSHSHITRAYLTAAEKGGRVVNVSDDLPKSFVVCMDEDNTETVYLSQLASATLNRRMDALSIDY